MQGGLYNAETVINEPMVYLVARRREVDTFNQYGLPSVSPPEELTEDWQDSYTEFFKGRHVVILYDNDEQGRGYIFYLKVFNEIGSVAKETKPISIKALWPEAPVNSDISAFFATFGQDGIKILTDTVARTEALVTSENVFLTDDWPHKNNNGKPIRHWENTRWLLLKKGISFRYNELTKVVEPNTEELKQLTTDSIITEMRGICALNDYSITKADMSDHIMRIAEESAYNPVCDYLNDCLKNWDGKSRTRELFEMFVLNTASPQDPEFLYGLFLKWLITCAKMPFNKGEEAAQGVLVLFGPQGIGKTRWLYKLLPNPDWGKSGMMIDLRNKDTVMQALGYWIVELGEYGRNLAAEKNDHYKAFVTDSTDIFRTPYARSAERHPRTTVFYATTDRSGFLNDDAGERRNWTISIDGIEEKEIDMNQLWGEVAHMALVEKLPHWLTKEEIARLNLQNEAYKVRSAEYELLYDAFNWDADKSEWIWLTSTEICTVLDMDNRRVPQIGRALTQMQVLGVEKSTNTGRKKYTIPPFKSGHAMQDVRMRTKDYRPQAVNIGEYR